MYNHTLRRLFFFFWQALKEKAALRNPDEFYFGMINSKTRNGVHVSE